MQYVAVLWGRYLVHIVDVLIVSYIFYQILRLIQGTRAVQIAVGILIIALATVLAEILGFPSLKWLLQKFWIAGVVMIAVLFQPEIRSALARLGTKTARRFAIHEEMHVINELVGAAKEAARRQMGLLLVVERDTGLRNYIESGTTIDGEVTRELLLTIFQPPSILHDGAVIVRGNRLVAAGCILPLSQDPSLSRLLGTRHRAAVGITEVSDAWAVCVSEETGDVSVAADGKLEKIDPDELRQRLLNLFHSQEDATPAQEAKT
jgi:diadenylate cyclase